VSTDIGRVAEDAAAAYLKKQKLKIIARNWRTRWCEIDIIATKKKIVYFVEVKYRKSESFGTGFDYITPRKLGQMQFAAEFWLASNTEFSECHLSAIELAGEPPKVTNWLPDIE
jgi:uncharacterized protein (TIGR00252 family)